MGAPLGGWGLVFETPVEALPKATPGSRRRDPSHPGPTSCQSNFLTAPESGVLSSLGPYPSGSRVDGRSPDTGRNMIEVERLSKRYGSVKAVDRVTFTVGRGEIVGLLGPNGAGKT